MKSALETAFFHIRRRYVKKIGHIRHNLKLPCPWDLLPCSSLDSKKGRVCHIDGIFYCPRWVYPRVSGVKASNLSHS